MDDTAKQARGEILESLRFPKFSHAKHSEVKNANTIHEDEMSSIDKMALWVTNKVGSVGFFLIIFVWTVSWTSYNILATKIPGLHWKAFDPFPAFVAYLLISNVIQILLMPMIMVGQNVQSRHTEIRAELDFEINKKTEEETAVILKHLEHNTSLILQMMKYMDVAFSDDELRQISHEISTSSASSTS